MRVEWAWVRRWRVGSAVPVRVVGRAPLTHSHAVFVVEVGSRRIVVGTGPHAVSLLGDLPAPEETPDRTGGR